MKICRKCKIEKPFDAFHRCKSKYDGYQSACAECYKLRRLELKKNPLMQLEKEIKSSVILENKLLKRENKRLCNGCKEIFLIDDLSSGVICKDCSSRVTKEYKKNNKEKINVSQREYRLKKKLEKQNNT